MTLLLGLWQGLVGGLGPGDPSHSSPVVPCAPHLKSDCSVPSLSRSVANVCQFVADLLGFWELDT